MGYTLMAGILILHFFDGLFTLLILLKIKAKNAYETENNFIHRFFMKKFGIVKGILISFLISFFIIGSFAYILRNDSGGFVLLGINFAFAYNNFLTWRRWDLVELERK